MPGADNPEENITSLSSSIEMPSLVYGVRTRVNETPTFLLHHSYSHVCTECSNPKCYGKITFEIVGTGDETLQFNEHRERGQKLSWNSTLFCHESSQDSLH